MQESVTVSAARVATLSINVLIIYCSQKRMHVRPMSIISRKPMPPGGFCYLEREPLSPGPHQQQCPSNIVERYKLNDSFDNVECCFDIVAVSGNKVAGFGNNGERNFVFSTMSKQIEHVQSVSTLSKGRNFVRHCCRLWQQCRMLLRQCCLLLRCIRCRCERGLRLFPKATPFSRNCYCDTTIFWRFCPCDALLGW